MKTTILLQTERALRGHAHAPHNPTLPSFTCTLHRSGPMLTGPYREEIGRPTWLRTSVTRKHIAHIAHRAHTIWPRLQSRRVSHHIRIRTVQACSTLVTNASSSYIRALRVKRVARQASSPPPHALESWFSFEVSSIAVRGLLLPGRFPSARPSQTSRQK